MASEEEWWNSVLPQELWQGDIFSNIPILVPSAPTKYLRHSKTLKGGVQSWEEHSDAQRGKDGRTFFLAQGLLTYALLINHSCDLDKKNNARVLFAHVASLNDIAADQREHVENQESIARLFLPGVPSLGHAFADLRVVCTVPRETINSSNRIASMTDAARLRLHAQILKFFSRR